MEALYAQVIKSSPVIYPSEVSYENYNDKVIVEDIIFSRFGEQWKSISDKLSKKRSRCSLSRAGSTESTASYPSTEDNSVVSSETSVNTDNMSALLAGYCNGQSCGTPTESRLNTAFFSDSEYEEFEFENPDLFEIDVQRERIVQIQKALSYCGSSFSMQRMEAERLLLVAMEKKKLLEDQISSPYQKLSLPVGNISISNVQLLSYNLRDKDTMYYFVCLWMWGTEILSSKVISSKSQFLIDVDGEFIFDQLTSDFEIKLKVFVLKEKKESKWDFLKPCHVIKGIDYRRGTPIFELWCEVIIDMTNLRTLPDCIIMLDDPTEPASCWVRGNFIVDIDFSPSHEGFLDVAKITDACPFWDQMWCLIDGTNFMYWSHPSQKDYSPCLNSFDLRDCLSVKVAKKGIFFRKWTLILSLRDDVAYFLTAESEKCMYAWYGVINDIIHTHETWGKFLN